MPRLGNRNALVPPALRARPVDRDEGVEMRLHTSGGWRSSPGAVSAGFFRRGGGAGRRLAGSLVVGPLLEDPRRSVASAKAEGEARSDRRRAEDQPERHHHDLVGKPMKVRPIAVNKAMIAYLMIVWA